MLLLADDWCLILQKFSVFSDISNHQHLYNMKYILNSWNQYNSQKLPKYNVAYLLSTPHHPSIKNSTQTGEESLFLLFYLLLPSLTPIWGDEFLFFLSSVFSVYILSKLILTFCPLLCLPCKKGDIIPVKEPGRCNKAYQDKELEEFPFWNEE